MSRFVYFISIIFTTSIAGAKDFSPLWKVLDNIDVVGVTQEGNGVCTKSGTTYFGTNVPTAQEIAGSLSRMPCLKLTEVPDSDLNAYRCDDKDINCEKKFLGRLNKEFNCNAQLQNVLPQESDGKKLGNIIVFKTANCRTSLLNHKIPCAPGFVSQYLTPDQKGYKICSKQPTGGSQSIAPAPSGSGKP